MGINQVYRSNTLYTIFQVPIYSLNGERLEFEWFLSRFFSGANNLYSVLFYHIYLRFSKGIF